MVDYIQVLLNKVVVNDHNCWQWSAGKSSNGYAKVWLNNKMQSVHRIIYEYCYGDIKEGLQIDHLCRNRSCVNPIHLEAISQRENTLRGQGITANQARQTHCKNGHPLSGDNLRMTKNHRRCKVCQEIYNRKYRMRYMKE